MSADMGTEVELSLTVPERELRTARKTIQDGIGDVQVGVQTGTGAASRATGGGGAGGATGRMQRRTFRWARQRTEHLQDTVMLLDEIAQNVARGGMGGGGGGGGLLGGAAARLGGGALGGGVSSLIGGVSAGAVIQKVPLRSLLKKAPAFATLVTAADLGKDLVTGKLTAEEIVEAPIELGQMVTFGALDNKKVEAAIGTVTLAIGTYQIGSIVAGRLAGSALAGYFGTLGIGSILTGLGAGTAGVTLSGLLLAGGTLSLADLIDGDISDWNLPARFGNAMGEAVREEFPDLASTIHEQFTKNNPFAQAARSAQRFLTPGVGEGRTSEDVLEEFGPTGPVIDEETLERFRNQQTDPSDLAPGELGRVDGQRVVGTEGGGVERVYNINVTDDKSINITRDITDRELVERLADMGVDPNTIQEIERKVDQIQRGTR